ncbi:hypothetical protein [Azospirillum sp. sgz301742]
MASGKTGLGALCALAFAGLLAGPGAASATALPEPGSAASASVELLGKRIPLPPGPWQVAASGFGRAETDGVVSGAYGAIGGVLLVRPPDRMADGAADRGFVLARTNVLPVQDGWGQPSECAAEGMLFQSASEARHAQNACSFITPIGTYGLGPAGQPGQGAGGGGGIGGWIGDRLPPVTLVAGLRVSDRRDVIDVRFGLLPPGDLNADWSPAAVAADPERAAMIERLGDWVQGARAVTLAALRDPPDQVPALKAPYFDAAATEKTPEEISALRMSVYKLMSYRVLSSSHSFLVATLLAGGNVATGAWVALWQGLTHSTVYWGNEMAWEWPPSVPVTTFTTGR